MLSDTNPVHEENGKWYFWIETWHDREGPFSSEAQANMALNIHCEYNLHSHDDHKRWVLYVLRLKNGSYYTGITNCFPKRFHEHREGTGSKYVRSHLPFKVVYVANAGKTRSEAQKLESKIKKLSHKKKKEMDHFRDESSF